MKTRGKNHFLFAAILLTFCVISLIFTNEALIWFKSRETTDDILRMDQHWNLTYNDKKYEDVTLSTFKFPVANRGETITMTGRLPDMDIASPVFVMLIRYTDIRVLVDGEEVYSFGQDRLDAGKVTGSGYVHVSLPDDYEGKEIKIILRVGEEKAFTTIEVPVVCNHEKYTRIYASRRIWSLSSAFFLVVFGVAVIFVVIIIIFTKFLTYSRIAKLFWMGLFSLNAGFWIMCTSEITEIFSDDIIFKVYLEYLSVYTVPFYYLCYHTEGNDNSPNRVRRYLFRIIAIANIVFILTATVLQATGTVNLPSLLLIGQVLDLFTLGYVLSTRLIDIKKKRTGNFYSLFGTLVVTVFAIMELISFNVAKFVYATGDAEYHIGGLHVAIMIFVSSLFLDYINETFLAEKDKAEIEIMSHLAYTDVLTGINNRQATEDFFDKVDRDQKAYGLIEFDLNELKKVNDEQGHDEGDNYIKAFADILKTVFNGRGFIGRTGGDEFIAVVTADIADVYDDVYKYMKALEAEIDKENSKQHIVTLSEAHGICYSDDPAVKNIRQALKIADQRMYDNKVAMKKAR